MHIFHSSSLSCSSIRLLSFHSQLHFVPQIDITLLFISNLLILFICPFFFSSPILLSSYHHADLFLYSFDHQIQSYDLISQAMVVLASSLSSSSFSAIISVIRKARSDLHTTVWVWLAPLLGVVIILIAIGISYYLSCCYANKLDQKQTQKNLQSIRLPVTISTSDHKTTTIESTDSTSIQNPIPITTDQDNVSNQPSNDVAIETFSQLQQQNGITEELKQSSV